MMETIYFTEEQNLLREQVRRFVTEVVQPHGDAWEAAGYVPRAVLRQMGALGFFGIRYPEQYGGIASNALSSVVLAEELGRSTFGGFAVTVLVHTDMASPHLARFGTPAQLDAYLPGVIRGDLITAVGVTEPDAGSDVQGMRATARRDGDTYVLNGSKMFITNGVHADLYFIAAKTNPQAKGAHGTSIFLVEKGTPGFTVSKELHKTGWLSSDTAELNFADCRIPAANLLGEENKGFYAIMRNFQNERLVLGAMAIGEAQKGLDLTVEYVQNRKAFGGVLYDKQTIRQRLSLLSAKVAAARQLVYHTAWLDSQGRECIKEVSMVKALCGELVNEVMYTCQQFHGGFGYMRECAIERMVRDARVQAIAGGATEVMLEEVGKRLGAS